MSHRSPAPPAPRCHPPAPPRSTPSMPRWSTGCTARSPPPCRPACRRAPPCQAFERCTLASIDMSAANALTRIGGQAFAECTALSSVVLPNGVLKVIDDGAFQGCTSLTGVMLPATLTWHSRLQNHTFRHRAQRDNVPPLLPQARHEGGGASGAIGEVLGPGGGASVPLEAHVDPPTPTPREPGGGVGVALLAASARVRTPCGSTCLHKGGGDVRPPARRGAGEGAPRAELCLMCGKRERPWAV